MVLVLHVKRFAFGSYSGKVSKHIGFEQYLEVPVSKDSKENMGGGKKHEKYALTGIIVHHGSSVNSGHYVAFIKV